VRTFEDHLPLNQKITPGEPMMSTEGGYQMGNCDCYKGIYEDGKSAPFSEAVHGRYLMRYALEQYRLGYRRSFIYELLDIDQPKWGLFRADGSARPAAYGFHNMIKLLNDAVWNRSLKRWITPNYVAGKLKYTLSAQRTVHSLLLQKSNGKFYLVLWNEVLNWNSVTGEAVYPPAVSATLSVKQPIRLIRTFLPLTKGTDVVQTSNRNTNTFVVPDHPIIVEISVK
jgi:serralysin